jgi:hypothetical protein
MEDLNSEFMFYITGNNKKMYTENVNECDYYVVVTDGNVQYYREYDTGTIGYSLDFYVQIFDVKNKVKYKKTYIATMYPPISFFSYNNPKSKYPEKAPDDEILAFIKEAIKQ